MSSDIAEVDDAELDSTVEDGEADVISEDDEDEEPDTAKLCGGWSSYCKPVVS